MVTRITNTMMQNTLLSNLSLNLNRMDKLQNQLSSGRKFGHISDDPASLIYAQSARNKLHRISHFQGAVETAQSWLTQAEAGTMELQKVVGSIYEELVSAGSVKHPADKQILAMVVNQLNNHFVDTLNTSFGDRFVFAGYNTPGDPEGIRTEIKPFMVDNWIKTGETVPRPGLFFNGFNLSKFDKMPDSFLRINIYDEVTGEPLNDADLGGLIMATVGALPPDVNLAEAITFHRLMNDVKVFDVGPGIEMPISINGIDILFYSTTIDGETVMRGMWDMLTEVYNDINENKPTEDLTLLIKQVQEGQNHLLTKTAEIGGRQRRLELLHARYAQDNINYEQMRSDAEDADMAEVIMYLKMAETVYQAALSAGARVIQPTLMDFLR